LLKSLRGYKDNSRRGYDTQMADVAEALADADFADLAHYLARQK
jgi:cytochrome c553